MRGKVRKGQEGQKEEGSGAAEGAADVVVGDAFELFFGSGLADGEGSEFFGEGEGFAGVAEAGGEFAMEAGAAAESAEGAAARGGGVAGDPAGEADGFSVELAAGVDEGALCQACTVGDVGDVASGGAPIGDDEYGVEFLGAAPAVLAVEVAAIEVADVDGARVEDADVGVEVALGVLVAPGADEFGDPVDAVLGVAVAFELFAEPAEGFVEALGRAGNALLEGAANRGIFSHGVDVEGEVAGE